MSKKRICSVEFERFPQHDLSKVRVYLSSHPIDFRKEPDSLLSLLRELVVLSTARFMSSRPNGPTGSRSSGRMDPSLPQLEAIGEGAVFWPRIGHNRVHSIHVQPMGLLWAGNGHARWR